MSLPSLVRALEALLSEENLEHRYASERGDMMVHVGMLGVALTPSEINEIFLGDARFLPAMAGLIARRYD